MKKQTSINLLMLVVLLFGQLPQPVHAQAAGPTETPTTAAAVDVTATPEVFETPVEVPTETATLEPTASATLEVIPTETETPLVSETPETPTETATPTESVTATPTVTATATVSGPTPTEQVSPIVLKASTDFATAGGSFKLQWSLASQKDGFASYELVFTLGSGISARQTGQTNYATDELRIPAAKKGELEVSLAATAEAPYEIQVSLQKAKVTSATTSLTLLEKSDVPAAGGKIKGLHNKVQVEFSSGIFQKDAQVFISNPLKGSRPSHSLSGHPFEITAYQAGVQRTPAMELKTFSKQIVIRVAYDKEIYAGKETELGLYWYDPKQDSWIALPSSVDRENGVITAFTTHFTVFDKGLNDWKASKLPSIEAFQTSGFTGAATYSLPIEVPAGPGGIKPDLSLNYNSQVIDQSTAQSQASWAGMGWSLEVGSIERNMNGTTDWPGDDTYSLSVGGVSTTIILGSDGYYHTADENFWFINRDIANDAWRVRDNAGNLYTFTKTLDYYYQRDCEKTGGGMAKLPYIWSLTSMQNKFGQTILYNYDNALPGAASATVTPVPSETLHLKFYSWDPKKLLCNADMQEADASSAIYLNNITYADGHYRISFNREARTDFRPAWVGDGVYHSFERQRLKSIVVEHDDLGNGTYQPVRTYKLGYSSNVIWPGFWPSPIALGSITEVGSASAALPATTFSYADGMHLTSANNGYGGGVTFTYDQWPSPNSSTKASGDFSDSSCSEWGPGNCPDHSLPVDGIATHSDIPDMLRPGGVYRFTIKHSVPPDGRYTSIGLQINNLATPTRIMKTFAGNVGTALITAEITLPFNVAVLRPVIEEEPAYKNPADAYIENWSLTLVPSFYRVTKKVLTDGRQQNSDPQYPYTFTYAYEGPLMNTCTTIVTATSPCNDYTKPYSEFRGHSKVTETGPDGRKVITEYYQAAPRQGRAKTVTVAMDTGGAQGGTLETLQQTNYSYLADTDLPSTIPTRKPDTCTSNCDYNALPHYWVYLSSQEECNTECSSSTTIPRYTKYTKFHYESTYGNLTDQEETTGSGATYLYRRTHTDYFPGNVVWLYLPNRKQVCNTAFNPTDLSANTCASPLSESLYFYNSNLALSATRTLVDATSSPATYSQVSFGYDAYGNRNSVTTYSGYGTATSAPAAATASTTTTSYDDIHDYYAYPVTETNALNQQTTWTYDYGFGLPLTEKDANGAETSAKYDTFGRMIKLVRPGDDDANPTMWIGYYDTAQPFHIDLMQRTANTYALYRKVYDGMGRLIQEQTRTALVAGQSSLIITNSAYDAFGRVTSQTVPFSFATIDTPDFVVSSRSHTSTSYDVLGRPRGITQPDGTKVSYAYNGLTTTVTDANGHSTTTTSDGWGRVTKVTPPTGPEVTYSYYLNDLLKKTTRAGLDTTLTYDKAGRKLTMTDPDMGPWSYTYYPQGNLQTQTDARGCTLTMTYDLLNRMTQKSSADAPGHPGACGTQVNYTYTYDSASRTNGLGRRTGMTDAGGNSGSSDWDYDQRGRLSKETKTIAGQSYSTSWSYNSADLPMSTTYPDGEVVTNSYNTQQLLASVTGSMAGAFVPSISYDAAGRATQRLLGNGIQTTFGYNTWNTQGGRLNSITSGPANDPKTFIQSLTYDYDAVGNVNWIKDSVAGTSTTPQKQSFGYDALDRLTSANLTGSTTTGDPNYSEEYSYIPEAGKPETGNLEKKAGVKLTYGGTNIPPHAVSSTSSGNTYTYDPNGNMLTRHTESGDSILTYDAEGHLVTVSGPGTYQATFVYDGDGNRVKSTENGKVTVFIGNIYEIDPALTTDTPRTVKDASFDDTTSAWTSAQTSAGTSILRNGTFVAPRSTSTPNAYAITNNMYGTLTSDAIPVTANTDYDISAWVRGALAENQGLGGWRVRARFYDGDNYLSQVDVNTGAGASLSTTWQQVSGTVKTPESSGDLTMKIELSGYQTSGWVTYDDISVTQTGGDGTNLVQNAGFESAEHWTETPEPGYTGTWFERGSTIESAPHAGSYAYTITNNVSGNLGSNLMAVTPGTVYTVSAQVRGELDDALTAPGGGLLVRAVFYDDTNASLNLDADVISGTGATLTQTWQPVTGTVTVPANATKMRILLYNFHSAGWLAFDDVSVTSAIDSTNLVLNPGFEDGAWTETKDSPSTTIRRSVAGEAPSEASPRTGSSAYVITNNIVKASLTSNDFIAVSAGADYQIDAYLSGELADNQGIGGWSLGARFYKDATEASFISQVAATSGTGTTLTTAWKQVKGWATAPVGATQMKIVLISDQTSGWVAFDDVSVTEMNSLVKYYYAGAQRIAMRKNGALTYLLNDQLGSTSLAVDASGAKISEVRYKPWGEVRYEYPSSSLPTDYTFTGQRDYTDSFGLMYYNARWYDSSIGRFAQADTVIPGGVQGLDRYAYSNNSPIVYSDPTGHWPGVDYFMGIAYQYANDMTFGFLDKIAYSEFHVCLDCNKSGEFKEGQKAGRTITTAIAAYDTTSGAATATAALSAIPATGAAGGACAVVTAGACGAVAVPVIAVEAVAALAGAIQGVHGLALAARIREDRLDPDGDWASGSSEKRRGDGDGGMPADHEVQNDQSDAARAEVEKQLGITIDPTKWHQFVHDQHWGYKRMITEGLGEYGNR